MRGRRFWKSVCLQLVFLLVFSSLWCSIDGAAYPFFPATKPKLVNRGFTPISSSKGSWDGETPQPQARLKELVEETTDSESALPSPTNDEAFGRTDFKLSSLMEGQDSVPPAISSSTPSGGLDLSAGTDTSESRYGDKRSSHSFFYNSNAMRPMLLKHDADIGAVDLRGYTPLHVAVEAGHETLLKEIMKYTHASVNAKSASGWTPLHVAVEKGFLRCITALLEREDIDVNAEAINGFTPLHLAASDGLSDSANLLLNDPRTDVNAESDTGLTPLHLASLGDHGSTVRLLLSNKRSRKVKSKAGLLPLHFAASAGHVKILEGGLLRFLCLFRGFFGHGGRFSDVSFDARASTQTVTRVPALVTNQLVDVRNLILDLVQTTVQIRNRQIVLFLRDGHRGKLPMPTFHVRFLKQRCIGFQVLGLILQTGNRSSDVRQSQGYQEDPLSRI
ncbi:unnamed protein product [Cyprideis torosa]|uniref:Uncharacterized protein n=1 Tax=Cyprideis torosa TaxID=163714 RepID=A0A7R8W623_9CRUS|nr:unnamed protein product [Cyprideis torosa]CAG0885935.1 unnamed protein product [Cyprideis torosa]